MKLSDFYFADRHAAGTKMPILLPSGEDSGEWLSVMGPDCNPAIKAGRAYIAAIRAVENDLRPLFDASKATGDYREYNEKYSFQIEDLNRQFAAEIVVGWSFDNAFSKEAVEELLGQYRALTDAVLAHHKDSRDVLQGK